MKWDLDRVATIAGGTRHGSAVVTGVEVDSRRVVPGDLFVAVRGASLDGHEFIGAAFHAGAVAALAEPGRLQNGTPGVEVAVPQEALLALAEARRDEFDGRVVAVTGSSGKTTTKDLIVAAVGPGGHGAPLSFNNEVGVPLTILGCPEGALVLVVEVGSRGVGHIAALSPVIRPHVAVITNIGPAHLETFGDLDAVRRAKWELVEALEPGGVAVLPAGESSLARGVAGPTITFGEEETADVRAVSVMVDDSGRASFVLEHEARAVPIRLGVAGRHQAVNAAAAVAAAVAAGIDFDAAARRLEAAVVSPWRMEVVEARVGTGRVRIVNDAYNANPASMAAALETVAAMPGRHFAVLGKMHELGTESPRWHRDVGRLAAGLGFEVLVVGDDPGLGEGAGAGSRSFADVESAVDHLTSRLRPGDVVLVKASRAAGLESVAAMLGGERP